MISTQDLENKRAVFLTAWGYYEPSLLGAKEKGK